MTSRTSDGVVPRTDTAATAAAARGRVGAVTSPKPWLLAAPPLGLLVMLLALLAAGGAPEPVEPGLPDPGVLTRWGLPVSRLAFDVSAVAVVGGLVTALLLPAAAYPAAARHPLRLTGWAAWAWALSALLLTVLTVSDVLGLPPVQVFASDAFSAYVWELAQGRGLLLAAGGAVLVGAYSRWTHRRGGVAVLLALAVGALLPVLFSGHSAASADHDLATSSLVLHVVAASVWVGGLAGVLLLLRRTPQVLATVLPRYSALALVCFLAVAGSGLLNAWIRTSGDLALWADSGYGALLALKAGALAGLGVLGWGHRRRTIDAVRAQAPGAFARLAAVEVLLMAGTVGVAVALSRTPPPAGATQDIPSHGAGHPTLGDDVAPFTLVRVLTEWRPEAVTLAVVAVAFGCYLAGVRRLRAEGVAWPGARVAAATAAAAVALVATSGGVATYSTATFSAQVTQFLVLLVVVPALVALSAPVTMLLRVVGARGPADAPGTRQPDTGAVRLPSGPLGWLTDPLNMLIVATVMLFALYATPLLEASLRSAPLHLFVNLSTLAVGCLFWWSVLGVDPVADPRPRAYRLWVLLGFLLLLGGVGARIYLSDVLLAGAWFSDLDWSWVDMPADQRRGAALMWAGALTLGPLLALLTGVRRTAGR